MSNKNKKTDNSRQYRPSGSGTGTLSTGKIIGIIAAAVLLAAIIGMVVWENLRPVYLLNIDGEKYKQKDLIYEIYEAEQTGSMMANLYAQLGYADDYWTMSLDESGTTGAANAAAEARQAALQQMLLYKEATKAGYEATEEEKTKASEDAESTLKNMEDAQKKATGFTKESLTKIYTEYAVTARYKQDQIDGLDIDDEAIKAEINYDQYKGYKIEYFHVSTNTTDDAGNAAAMDDAAKKKAYEELEKVLKSAKGADDWSKVIDAEDKDAVVSYSTETLTSEELSDAENPIYSAEIDAAILKMENNGISEIVEVAEDGYYVFRMADNNSPEKYDEAVETAITDAENEAFNELYQKMQEKHEIKTYESNWEKLPFGSITM